MTDDDFKRLEEKVDLLSLAISVIIQVQIQSHADSLDGAMLPPHTLGGALAMVPRLFASAYGTDAGQEMKDMLLEALKRKREQSDAEVLNDLFETVLSEDDDNLLDDVSFPEIFGPKKGEA